MNILFLDDDENRTKQFRSKYPDADITKTAAETIEALQNEVYDIVCLDHDLGGEIYVDSGREDCGMEVVRWIEENCPDIETVVIVHSYNASAAEDMIRVLAKNYDVVYAPFGSTFFDLLERLVAE